MQRAQEFAEQGAGVVWWHGLTSQSLHQSSHPFSTITVYLSGTTTLAQIYSDNNKPPTPMANPFTANEFGYWWFYAADGRYDVTMFHEDLGDGSALAWTMGDVLLGDHGEWSADQNANGHWLRGLGGICFSNSNCPAGACMWLNDNCHIQMSACLDVPCLDVSGDAAVHGSLEVFGNASVFGYLQTPCVQFTNGGPSMWLCADSVGTLHFRNNAGTDIGSINQGGLFDIYKLVAQQIEGVQSIWSLGSLGSDGGILTHGAIYADGGLNGAYLNVSGCIYIRNQEIFCLSTDKHVGPTISVPCLGLTGVSLYLGCSYDARVGQTTGIVQLYAPLDDDPPLAAIPNECMMIVCGNTTGITSAGPEFVSVIVRDQFGALYSGKIPLFPGYDPTIPPPTVVAGTNIVVTQSGHNKMVATSMTPTFTTVNVNDAYYIQANRCFEWGAVSLPLGAGTLPAVACLQALNLGNHLLQGVSRYEGHTYDPLVGGATGIPLFYVPSYNNPPLASIPPATLMILETSVTELTFYVRDQFGQLRSGTITLTAIAG